MESEETPPLTPTKSDHIFAKAKFTKPVKCAVCRKMISGFSSAGYFCNVCKVKVHKSCVTKARKGRCDKHTVIKVKLQKGNEIVYNHDPSTARTIKETIDKIRKENDITEIFILWDDSGRKIDMSLIRELQDTYYYVPEGVKPPISKPVKDSPSKWPAKLSRSISIGGGVPQLSSRRDIVLKKPGIISCTIGESQNLANNSSAFEWLYVVISDNMSEKRFRTIPINNTTQPSWSQTFKFNINYNRAEFTIKIWASNKNPTVADKLLGQCLATLEEFSDGEEFEKVYKLRKEYKKGKGTKIPGSIVIKWKYSDKKKKKGVEEVEKIKIITDVYEIGRKIGDGAFSIVKQGRHKEKGFDVAIKILDNYSNMQDAEEDLIRFKQEKQIIATMDHKNIIKCHDIFEDRDHYYVVMEIVTGGELFDAILEKGSFKEEECLPLLIQVLEALVYLEEQKICHRDLKPENILFTNKSRSHIKIIDFGEARSCADGRIQEYAGTTDYMSPEVVRGTSYDTRVDTWSLGVITYIMLSGFPPWDGKTESEVFVNIMNMKYSFPSPDWDKISNEAKNFIQSLLTDHDQRLTAKQALRHPWIKSYNPKPIGSFKLELPDSLFQQEIMEKITKILTENLDVNAGTVELQKEDGKTVARLTLHK